MSELLSNYLFRHYPQSKPIPVAHNLDIPPIANREEDTGKQKENASKTPAQGLISWKKIFSNQIFSVTIPMPSPLAPRLEPTPKSLPSVSPYIALSF